MGNTSTRNWSREKSSSFEPVDLNGGGGKGKEKAGGEGNLAVDAARDPLVTVLQQFHRWPNLFFSTLSILFPRPEARSQIALPFPPRGYKDVRRWPANCILEDGGRYFVRPPRISKRSGVAFNRMEITKKGRSREPSGWRWRRGGFSFHRVDDNDDDAWVEISAKLKFE